MSGFSVQYVLYSQRTARYSGMIAKVSLRPDSTVTGSLSAAFDTGSAPSG